MPEQINLEIILIFSVFILFGVIFYLVMKLSSQSSKSDDTAMKMLQKQMFQLNKNIDFKLAEVHRSSIKQSEIHTTISHNANKKIEEITKKLSSLEETNKQIKDIGGQLRGLEDILKNPKQRGILGEYFLEQILQNILPPENYELQYKFSNGEIVDAAIFVNDKIIPIDAKFSLENYNKLLQEDDSSRQEQLVKQFKQDLKKRIDETSKYIRPQEQTMDFAFMFLPSEGMYYDLLVNKIGSLRGNMSDIIEYAFTEKKVIIVSPTSFYAYLQTVMQGLRALQIEQTADDIRKQVSKLGKHLQDYEIYFEKLGTTLGTTVNHYNTAYKKFNLLEKDIIKISGGDTNEIQTVLLDKPDM